VPPEARGRRLDLVLAELDPELSRSQASRAIREGHVQVLTNGQPAKRLKPGLLLHGDETLTLERPEHFQPSATPEFIPLDIRYEDDDLLVINKPAGMVVHPAPGHARGTLANALAAYTAHLSSVGGPIRPGIVHRLDKDTSGLLLVAKHDRAHRALAAQLADRMLSREYCALVWGHPDPPDGRIEAPIGHSLREGTAMAVAGRGSRNAATRYHIEETYPYTSWLTLHLETGRTHQIRVHLAHIGHPVVGDPDYGGREKAVRGIAPTWHEEARTLLTLLRRQALHARRVSFCHPTSGQLMTIVAEPPEDIQVARRYAARG